MSEKSLYNSSLNIAKQVINAEAKALMNLANCLDDSFEQAIKLILSCCGRIVIIGMGKSGHIAKKIAATFASTGTPAFFVHPAELLHGDFGMLKPEDIVIAISNSGKTSEIINILIPIKRRGLKLISITSDSKSALAEHSDIVLDINVKEEACPLNLAPTTSTTTSLALGDALAIVLMQKKQFTEKDFATFHPGGNLGRKLIKVSDLMRKDLNSIPTVFEATNYKDILEKISSKGLGLTCVLDEEQKLIGIITDGDLRRSQLKFQSEVYNCQAKDIMNAKPQIISANCLASEALFMMENKRISDLIIVSDQYYPIGIIDLKDLLKAGIY